MTSQLPGALDDRKRLANARASAAEPHRAKLSDVDDRGAEPDGPASDSALGTERTTTPDLTNAELVTLRIRVIALENLMISLLATG